MCVERIVSSAHADPPLEHDHKRGYLPSFGIYHSRNQGKSGYCLTAEYVDGMQYSQGKTTKRGKDGGILFRTDGS